MPQATLRPKGNLVAVRNQRPYFQAFNRQARLELQVLYNPQLSTCARWLRMMKPGDLFRDLQYAARTLLKTPSLTVIALLSFAIGIAANTTIFSVIYTVLLAPPLYKDADRLVVVWESNPVRGAAKTPVAPATFRDWRESSNAFEQLELVAPGSPVTVSGSGLPERANIQYATPDLFQLLGVQPTLGRAFVVQELRSADPVVLSYGFWQRHFGGAADVLGQHLIVNGSVHTIVGVLPKDFHLFNPDTDLWEPILLPGPETQDRSFRSWLIAVGRLAPGFKQQSAQHEMDVLAREIAQAHPDTNKDWGVKIEPIQEAQFGYWKPILYLLFGVVAFVLLISCANVASLLLGRLPSRERELSIRASLGASRSRLALQLLKEGLLIGALGALSGWIMTYWGIALFVALAPSSFPLLHSIQINIPVLAFCIASSIVSGVLLSLGPAILGSRTDLNRVLNKAARMQVAQKHRQFRSAFVISEIALSLVLLFGAGLMINSFLRLIRVDPGFRQERVLTMQIFLTGPKYIQTQPDGVHIHEAVGDFYRRLLERVNELPGVFSVGLASWLPEEGYNTGRRERRFSILGRTADRESQGSAAAFNAVSAGYFKTLEIPLLKGRDFTSTDDEKRPWVAIVNQAFARRYWAGVDPIGKQLLTGGGSAERPREVVGVVADVRQDTLERAAEPEIFGPFLQQPGVASPHGYQNRVHMTVVLQTGPEPTATIAAVRKIAAEMDDNQPIYGVRTMSAVVSDSMAFRRLCTSLLEIFAGIALFLSAVGIYGVVSHSVDERSGEIGLRMAIGATGWDILRLVFKQGMKLTLVGLAIGLMLAALLDRILASFLFAISANDPVTLTVICGVVLLIACGAMWFPAHRATSVDPSVALRSQ
jgi:putative ABC transport system permease protein